MVTAMKKLRWWVLLTELSASALWALPRGNYRQTCRSCRIFYRMGQRHLFCRCLDKMQIRRSTWLKVRRCDFVTNANGRLVCTRRKHGWSRHWRRRYRLMSVSAGPIWNNADAKSKCPGVCQNVTRGRSMWNGQWNTVASGSNSVCQCKVSWG